MWKHWLMEKIGSRIGGILRFMPAKKLKLGNMIACLIKMFPVMMIAGRLIMEIFNLTISYVGCLKFGIQIALVETIMRIVGNVNDL